MLKIRVISPFNDAKADSVRREVGEVLTVDEARANKLVSMKLVEIVGKGEPALKPDQHEEEPPQDKPPRGSGRRY